MIPAALLTNALLVGAALFCLGLVGILTRRNLIVMFLCAEMMLQGVAVTLVLPEKVDSFLTRYASRSYYDDLLDAGVVIQLYRGGLLHTKSISVDGTMSRR